ncbi:MAG TPA: hemolysin, partial [Alphaproteobacteria bacterium]|nr:hemolysin [Alphaproteobacteria bacterium]
MVAYRSILGFELELTPWLGRNVAFLTPPDRVLDPAAMGRLLAAVDAAWDLQVALNGRQPVPLDDHRLDGRTVIAVVPQSCGAGCGYLGGTGIELQDRWFDYLHAGLVAGIGFDQIVFYELGR